MTLTLLVFGGGFIFWLGLINAQKLLKTTGFVLLAVAFALLYAKSGVDHIAIPFLILVGLLALFLKQTLSQHWLIVGWIIFAVIAIALKTRVFPFFTPVETIQTIAAEGLHTFQFPAEKIVLMLLVPTMVLLPWSYRYQQEKTAIPWLTTLLVLAGTALAILPIALITGFIKPGITSASISFLAYWLCYNLIYTCVIEEAFFRGILQVALIRQLSKRFLSHKARIIGILVTALLFGIAHFAGGFTYVILATIAGAGYGLAYDLSGRLHHAVLVHFAINAIHILLFAGK